MRSTVTSHGAEPMLELWEVIPIYRGEESASQVSELAPLSIELWSAGQWLSATEELTQAVSKVRIQRYGGTVYLHF